MGNGNVQVVDVYYLAMLENTGISAAAAMVSHVEL